MKENENLEAARENTGVDDQIKELAALIKDSNKTIVLTGAGMDTESNIPDFRSKDGWWRKMDPRAVASIDTFYQNYDLFWEFYKMRYNLLQECAPHRGHYILAEWEEKGLIHGIATQNISRLHALAGSKKVYELHGNIRTFRCNHCHRDASVEEYLEKKNCQYCGKKALRPKVTLFGESLPADAWDNSIREVQSSDLLMVIGTSLEVYPVNAIPKMAGGKTAFINNEDRGRDYHFDVRIKGKAKEVLSKLDGILNEME